MKFIEANATVSVESIGEINKNDDSITHMDKNTATIPWGIKAIGADLAHLKNEDGKDVKIAVLDTGIATHPDLKVAGGISFIAGNPSYADDFGHGTHVAGTIGAEANKMGVIGVAPRAELYAVKVLDHTGSGDYATVIQGIDWSIANHMDIISMSFGGAMYSQALENEIQDACNHGILVIAAAGNNGGGDETEIYPALYPEVVSVGAVNKADQRASFSSTGSQLDLVAPGQEILSTTMDGGYGILSGTSMAAPHVTGAAALLWSEHKKWTYQEVVQHLYDTATPLGSAHEYGHGLVNIAKALGQVNGPIDPVEPPTAIGSFPEQIPETSINLNQEDVKLLGLSKQLYQLMDQAMKAGNTAMAKQALQQYNDLLIRSSELYKLAEPNSVQSKSDYELQTQSNNLFFASHLNDFTKLEQAYEQAINQLQSAGFSADSGQ